VQAAAAGLGVRWLARGQLPSSWSRLGVRAARGVRWVGRRPVPAATAGHHPAPFPSPLHPAPRRHRADRAAPSPPVGHRLSHRTTLRGTPLSRFQPRPRRIPSPRAQTSSQSKPRSRR